jgi:hypothetical protein
MLEWLGSLHASSQDPPGKTCIRGFQASSRIDAGLKPLFNRIQKLRNKIVAMMRLR